MDYNIDTLSICEHCYRHVKARKFEKDGSIWITKTCPEHNESTYLVEPDANFYINYKYERRDLQSYFIEITNRCNLACPHCYQLPDNNSVDESIESILNRVKLWPNDGYPVSLVGAEPTMRKDLIDIIFQIRSLHSKSRNIMILTNGVKLANENFAKQFKDINGIMWTFGLNHKSYQGPKVREKQIKGIENCIKFGLPIKNISYTLMGLEQLEDCIEEIVNFGVKYSPLYRIRSGANIGRSPDREQVYLSHLVNTTKQICIDKNYKFEVGGISGNRAHYPVKINDIPVKLIQWPDVTTIDLSEIQTEAIADILPNKPPSPLVHQVILRDGAINKGLPLLDTIPDEWLKNYGKIKGN